AARGARATAGDAAGRPHVPSLGSHRGAQSCGVSEWVARIGIHRGPEYQDRVSVCRWSGRPFPRARNLVALKPAEILMGSTSAILAARKVTRTTPMIWFGSVDDPVALGLVESFARPNGNVTGFLLSSDARMVTKRLELLLDAAPGFSRVGVLLAPDYATADGT